MAVPGLVWTCAAGGKVKSADGRSMRMLAASVPAGVTDARLAVESGGVRERMTRRAHRRFLDLWPGGAIYLAMWQRREHGHGSDRANRGPRRSAGANPV